MNLLICITDRIRELEIELKVLKGLVASKDVEVEKAFLVAKPVKRTVKYITRNNKYSNKFNKNWAMDFKNDWIQMFGYENVHAKVAARKFNLSYYSIREYMSELIKRGEAKKVSKGFRLLAPMPQEDRTLLGKYLNFQNNN
jgi:hypothetical protein